MQAYINNVVYILNKCAPEKMPWCSQNDGVHIGKHTGLEKIFLWKQSLYIECIKHFCS